MKSNVTCSKRKLVLQHLWHPSRKRLHVPSRTPGSVPFWICIPFKCWDKLFFHKPAVIFSAFSLRISSVLSLVYFEIWSCSWHILIVSSMDVSRTKWPNDTTPYIKQILPIGQLKRKKIRSDSILWESPYTNKTVQKAERQLRNVTTNFDYTTILALLRTFN